jgi:glyoxylase-like metal-dependent hydrolase (beta-lactamase superfamily II)
MLGVTPTNLAARPQRIGYAALAHAHRTQLFYEGSIVKTLVSVLSVALAASAILLPASAAFAAPNTTETKAAKASQVKAAAAKPPAPKLSVAQAGYLRLKVGDVEVTALSDGTVALPVSDLLTNAQPGEIDKALGNSFQKSPLELSVNAYVFRVGKKVVLVDTGAGSLFGPSLGKLPLGLKAAGFSPEEVTDILITHIHADHTGGLVDGDKRVFSNAAVHLDKREAAFWLDPAQADKAPAAMKPFFEFAQKTVGPYKTAGKLQTFDGETKLLPGVKSLATPGHTPGHSFYSLESKGERLVFWGDIVHVGEVQFPNPSVTIQFDADTTAAAAQRKKAFADAAKGGYLVAPAHISFPGIGHLRVDGEGYRWLPLPYLNDAVAAH